MSNPTTDRPSLREQLLHAVDFAYCQTLGYSTPEELLAAYDASRTPADQGALRDRIADVLADADGWRWVEDFDKTASPTYQGYLRQAAAVLAVLPAPADRTTVLREAAHVADGGLGDECGCGGCAECARYHLGQELRRMADEVQQGDDEGLSGPCDCGEGAVHYTTADCPAEQRRVTDETTPLREIAEAALATVEAALGDTLVPAARVEALAGIAAVLPAPADRAAVLREAADAIDATFTGPDTDRYVRYGADLLRRLAAEQPAAEAWSSPDSPYRRLLAALETEHARAQASAGHAREEQVGLTAAGLASGFLHAAALVVREFEGPEAAQAYAQRTTGESS